jgi:hypothetical protein
MNDELVLDLENLYGGPRDWPKGICGHPSNDEDGAIEIWNAAVEACIEIVRKK